MSQMQPTDWLGESPAALIRTIDGRIIFWSPAMERRYGFASDDAVGRVSHRLLRTTSWQAVDELNASLLHRKIWRGGVIHCRADDQPVMTTNHWFLHDDAGTQDAVVTELHSDIVPAGIHNADELADIIAALAQELGQPLAAISRYVGGAQIALDKPWRNRAQLDEALARAVDQLTRAGAIVSKMRALGAGLRDPRLVQLHHKVAKNMGETHRIAEHAGDLIRAALEQRGEDERRAGRTKRKP